MKNIQKRMSTHLCVEIYLFLLLYICGFGLLYFVWGKNRIIFNIEDEMKTFPQQNDPIFCYFYAENLSVD